MFSTKSHLSYQRGFTLLEVLIALAILAISSIAVVGQAGQSIRQLEQLELKTMALWIADNQIAVYQMNEQWPNTGHQSLSLDVLDQEWLVSTQVSATSDPMLRKIEVSVALDNGREPVDLLSLIAYRGRY
ncbi:MAG: type II secretion system minor pseudopilin GspI [Spongiibacteraceae bacterium]|nr:type II secretion system minor pseudopilin GspI [Spongiibacteraceae bacterium]